MQKNAKKFAHIKKKQYLCIRFSKISIFESLNFEFLNCSALAALAAAQWCNGSTTDSGSVCLGSSPG